MSIGPARAEPAPSRTTAPSVTLRSVTKRFGEFTAVREMDLDIPRGQFFTMLGPSGCGKTTTLRMIAGFEEPTEGTVLLDGEDVTGQPAFRRPTNTVFQSYALFPHLSVERNVAFGLARQRVSKDEVRRRVGEELERVGLAREAKRRPRQLSGGQQQRVALARALVNRPAVLLLDEPLGALDLKLRKQLQIELKRIQQDVGITFVYVTHDQEEALTMSDRIAVFNEGKIEQVGPPAELYERPATEFVAGFVGVSNMLHRDGRDFTVRPEKIRLLWDDEPEERGMHVEGGRVRDVVYVGMVTRYIVDLDAGGELVVVRQNLETTSAEVVAAQGRSVRIGWRPEHTYTINGAEERKADE